MSTAGDMKPEAPVLPPTKLANLPISFFSVVMGLCGLTLAWEKAEQPNHLQQYH